MQDTEPRIDAENAISLDQACELFTLDGRRPNRVTVWRWCRKGSHGVKLAHGRIGRRLVTSKEACGCFIRHLAVAYESAEARAAAPLTPPPALSTSNPSA